MRVLRLALHPPTHIHTPIPTTTRTRPPSPHTNTHPSGHPCRARMWQRGAEPLVPVIASAAPEFNAVDLDVGTSAAACAAAPNGTLAFAALVHALQACLAADWCGGVLFDADRQLGMLCTHLRRPGVGERQELQRAAAPDAAAGDSAGRRMLARRRAALLETRQLTSSAGGCVLSAARLPCNTSGMRQQQRPGSAPAATNEGSAAVSGSYALSPTCAPAPHGKVCSCGPGLSAINSKAQ